MSSEKEVRLWFGLVLREHHVQFDLSSHVHESLMHNQRFVLRTVRQSYNLHRIKTVNPKTLTLGMGTTAPHIWAIQQPIAFG